MKYTTQGNCPFCDSERGIQTAWGMSPQGMAELKARKIVKGFFPENKCLIIK